MAHRKPVPLPPIVIYTDQPCKNGQPYVAADGSCLRCGADQGVHGYACSDHAVRTEVLAGIGFIGTFSLVVIAMIVTVGIM